MNFYLTYSIVLDENKITINEIVDFFGTNIPIGKDVSIKDKRIIYMKSSDTKREKIEQVIEEKNKI